MRKRRSDGTFHKLDPQIIQQRVSRCGDFLYVGGYSGSEGYVDLKCNICGTELRHSFVGIRHGKRITCKTCMETKRVQREEARRASKAAERKALREAQAKEKAAAKEAKEHEVICKTCGCVFVTRKTQAATCSPECAKKYQNNHKDNRLKGMPKDRSITLGRLIARDNNICWLCGGLCDMQDHKHNDNGVFIAGPTYPSIDHIVPIAKGGAHQWDNVALAHMRCNVIKRSQVVRTPAIKKIAEGGQGTEGRGHILH